MTKLILSGAVMLIALSGASFGHAHTPLCVCMDNGDGTILCEGGFSDGSSATGVSMEVRNDKGKTLIKGKMDRLSTFEFKSPSGTFTVIFDAGPGHVVEIPSRTITD